MSEEITQGANRSILVVEDEKPLQTAVVTKLNHVGFDAFGVRSVDEAIEALDAHPQVRAIWLDHYLFGKKSGLDLVETLKKEGSKWKSLPIFVVSNTASPDKVQRYLQLGVDEYFVKATNRLDEIIKDVQTVLENEE